MEFFDAWLWLTIMIIGLLLILMELIIGVNARLDLVFIGSSFILGGSLTCLFDSWVLTVIVSGSICIAFVAIGRRYIHRWTIPKKEQTNIDAVIGKKGFVTRDIDRRGHGVVRIGTETSALLIPDSGFGEA